MIRLSVTSPAGRAAFATDRTEILVGSREGADLRLDAPGVAPNHCLLRAEGDSLTLIDLGSERGVLFAGRPVREARLQAGSAFRVGGALLEVEAIEAPAAPAPPPRPVLELESDPEPAAPPAPPAAPVAKGSHADFAREVRRMLATVPWYAISLAVHLLVLLLLSLIPYDTREQFQLQQIDAAIAEESGSLEEAPDEIEPDLSALEDEQPEEDLEDLVEPEKKKERAEPMEMVERPEVVGIGQPKLNARIKPLKSPNALQITDGEANVSRGDAHAEQERAKAAASRGMERGLKRLRLLPADKVVVVDGEFDQMQTILNLYSIRHTTIQRVQLTKHNLDRAEMLCINCGRSPTPLERNVLVKRVRSFVQKGGWLLTSDWALAPYLTEAFPEFVREVTPSRRQLDTTVEVRPKATSSPLIDGVFARRLRTRWWLEEASKFVAPKGSKVNVLIESPDMESAYGSGLVAIEFRPSRRGRVVHLIGHFFQKDGNRAGIVGMHRLILNYLQERFVTRAGDR